MENTRTEDLVRLKLPTITIFDYDESETETDHEDREDTDHTLSVEELENAVFELDDGE